MNAFTVDVEEHFQVAALKDAIDVESWPSQESRVVENTSRLLDILAEANVRATFFILGWVAERNPELVRKISGAGHEIACHGQSHQLIYEQEQKRFESETLRARKTLEDITGAPVAGYRAASYSITKDSIWALDVIQAAGFNYDSSIVPARHDLYGISDAPDKPYRISLANGGELMEFPPSTLKLAGQRIPVGGGGYFRIFPYWFTRWALSRLNGAQDQPFAFYVHPWEIDVDQPRVETNWRSRFRHYTNLDKCEPRLRRLVSDFQFDTMRSVLTRSELPLLDIEDICPR